MNTLHGIRKFAFAALAMGALLVSVAQADANCASGAHGSATTLTDLGHITVLARREAALADLGSLTVTASRLTITSFADLGSLTVTAQRNDDARVADLGALTVTAKRIETVAVASAQTRNSFWK